MNIPVLSDEIVRMARDIVEGNWGSKSMAGCWSTSSTSPIPRHHALHQSVGGGCGDAAARRGQADACAVGGARLGRGAGVRCARTGGLRSGPTWARCRRWNRMPSKSVSGRRASRRLLSGEGQSTGDLGRARRCVPSGHLLVQWNERHLGPATFWPGYLVGGKGLWRQ